MKFSRREFMKRAAITGAGVALLPRIAWPFTQSPLGVTKFTVTLPGLGVGGANNLGNYIPALAPNTAWYPGMDYYEIVARQFTQQVHPAIPATKFWGYADAATLDGRYLGGVIVAQTGRPVRLKITNKLPARHILPVDPTLVDPIMAAETGGRQDRIAVHLHGGLVHWQFDGGPFHWFSNPDNNRRPNTGTVHGSSFINGAGPGAAIYDYPNNQSARLIWYHDHAYGLTRLNAYAGLATGYLTSMAIPNPCTGGTGRWESQGGTPPPISTVPEFFSDTALVNGAPYPTLGPLPPRRFRFRLLNGSQARFWNLQLYVADSSPDGITLAPTSEIDSNGNPILVPTNAAGPAFIQIGNEAGILPHPAVFTNNGGNLNSNRPVGYYLNLTDPTDPKNGNVNRYNLLLAPAERADVLIDFRGFEGKKLVLYNDAPAPFPGGDIRNDYYTGRPDLTCIGGAPANTPGQGPDTRILMQFVVGTTGAVTEPNFEKTVKILKNALPITFNETQPSTDLVHDGRVHVKTLNEGFDKYGRLIQLLGAPGVTTYLDSPTDFAQAGEVQRWKIYNLTGDTHPMHFHLVNVSIQKREAWKWTTDAQGNTIPVLPLQPIPGSAQPPDQNEKGWKETVRMNPGEVVTVDMKFDLPAGKVTPSPRLKAMYGIKGAEYVWHCHILEHEEHDMMHALVVT
ncbi:MAG: multicopper oxidase domain-containing protein [Verrucomicrobia bacterium]|nr:multicopper oxidase domain-containing protein [Verrucomicrobiota bacterium]